MKRSGPLRRTSKLRRGRPLARVNEKRAAERRARDFGEQAQLCRRLPCCVCAPHTFRLWLSLEEMPAGTPMPWPTHCDPHHEPSRGAGGADRDTVPLCRKHHTERHTMPLADFEAKYRVDLRAIAAELREVTNGQK